MSLVKKIKDILFEEEEITEPIKTVKPQVKEEVREVPQVRQEQRIEKTFETPAPSFNREDKLNEVPRREVQSERDIFKTDNGFKFPDFDEEEFQSSMPKRNKPVKSTNVLDYERKKASEKRNDFPRYEREKESGERKKFKPSPIISPVYGVLNQDYRPEDIRDKNQEREVPLNFEEVRKRAFDSEKDSVETLEETIEKIDEPVVTFFEEKNEVSRDKNREEMKTIDELLESASEEKITLEEELEMPTESNIDEIEEQLENFPEVPDAEPNLDDTLESDLFELIDSMYETREDGEE